MNDEKLNNEQVVDNSKVEDKNLNLDTPNEEKEENHRYDEKKVTWIK